MGGATGKYGFYVHNFSRESAISATLFLGVGIINQITGRQTQDVVSVALVYRYTDYAWGQEDDLYIIRQDGTVFDYHRLMKEHEDSISKVRGDVKDGK